MLISKPEFALFNRLSLESDADYRHPNMRVQARRFLWLCGESFPTQLLGAQGWPLSRPNSVDAPWGSPGTPPPVQVVQPGYRGGDGSNSSTYSVSSRL